MRMRDASEKQLVVSRNHPLHSCLTKVLSNSSQLNTHRHNHNNDTNTTTNPTTTTTAP